MKPVRFRIAIVEFVVAATLLPLSAATAAEADLTTPDGVTLVEVMRQLPISQPEVLWVRLGDTQGRTLFTYEKDRSGVSNCINECATEFSPFIAPKNVRTFGDWSTIRRNDGTRQWAYQSQPLYIWLQEQVPGEVATNVGLTETANSKFAEDAVEAGSLLPPDGWRVARFSPAANLTLPNGLDAKLVQSAQAVALTDSNGHTVYVFEGNDKGDVQVCLFSGCRSRWVPMEAPALAKGVRLGDFTVVSRKDNGELQWAYKGQPLYTYGQDKLPGDALGAGIENKWRVVTLTKEFRPGNVGIDVLDGYGATLTLNGMTLYGGYAFEKRWGGRNLRDTFTNTYDKGKALGDAACAPEDEECERNWRPFIAPANAQPSGFWEPIERQDGRKQWAYKGYALYTYAGDSAPGDHFGQATYDFEEVEGELSFQRVSFLQDISKASGGVGIYWNIAKP